MADTKDDSTMPSGTSFVGPFIAAKAEEGFLPQPRCSRARLVVSSEDEEKEVLKTLRAPSVGSLDTGKVKSTLR